jgi:hypothetical protein
MWLERLIGSRCRLCGRRARLQRLGEVAPTHPGPFHAGRFALVHCPRCEVVHLDPAPTPADLRVLYEESEQFSDGHYTDPAQVERILAYYVDAVRTLGLLPPDGGRVLEVGAGLAWVSRACKQIDPAVATTAQDVSGECARACPWADHYHVGPLATLPRGEGHALASMTHVIEHLVDPAAMLGEVAARLVPGGKLFVTAPFRPTGWAPERGIEGWSGYSYLHVPAHVSYLSRTWFERVAPRCGLSVTHWDAGHEDGQAFALVLTRT